MTESLGGTTQRRISVEYVVVDRILASLSNQFCNLLASQAFLVQSRLFEHGLELHPTNDDVSIVVRNAVEASVTIVDVRSYFSFSILCCWVVVEEFSDRILATCQRH